MSLPFPSSLFFLHIWFQKHCDLEIRIRGHSRSSKLVPLNRLVMGSY